MHRIEISKITAVRYLDFILFYPFCMDPAPWFLALADTSNPHHEIIICISKISMRELV